MNRSPLVEAPSNFLRGPIDKRDQALIEIFRKNPRTSNTAVSEELGIAKTTAAAHVRRLSQQHIMRIVASFDIGAVGYDLLAVVMVRVSRRKIEDVARDMVRMQETLSVQSVLGPFNLLVMVAARNRKHLLHVIETEIGSIAGIEGIRCDQILATELVRSEWGVLEEELPPETTRAFFDEFDRSGSLEFDAIDRVVIANLQRDGRTPLTQIARSAGVSEGTIRARLKRLEAEKHLQILALVDARNMGFVANAFLSINVEHRRLSATAAALAQMAPPIVMVATSHSGADIWAFTLARSADELLSLISERIGTLPGVESITPYPVIRYFKMDHRWVVRLD